MTPERRAIISKRGLILASVSRRCVIDDFRVRGVQRLLRSLPSVPRSRPVFVSRIRDDLSLFRQLGSGRFTPVLLRRSFLKSATSSDPAAFLRFPRCRLLLRALEDRLISPRNVATCRMFQSGVRERTRDKTNVSYVSGRS